ncbi:uncharacterized protein LOC103522713, partial [Diaphorina citri]|uniref:Uncharacterized protein LOC103522713 n=1 Tax=Diaphorina citri TaxID=121845 RepID=A0A3Q0JJF6_DIACI
NTCLQSKSYSTLHRTRFNKFDKPYHNIVKHSYSTKPTKAKKSNLDTEMRCHVFTIATLYRTRFNKFDKPYHNIVKHSYSTKPTKAKKSNLDTEISKVLDEYKSLDPVANAVRIREIKPIVALIQAIDQVKNDMKSLDDLKSDKSEDKEMNSLLEDEMKSYKEQLQQLEQE